MTKFKLLSLNYYTIRYNHMGNYKVICNKWMSNWSLLFDGKIYYYFLKYIIIIQILFIILNINFLYLPFLILYRHILISFQLKCYCGLAFINHFQCRPTFWNSSYVVNRNASKTLFEAAFNEFSIGRAFGSLICNLFCTTSKSRSRRAAEYRACFLLPVGIPSKI